MERAEIMSQILAILEDVAEISPEDVNENSVMMDDLDLSSMEILTVVADLEETFGLRIPEKELRNFVTLHGADCGRSEQKQVHTASPFQCRSQRKAISGS